MTLDAVMKKLTDDELEILAVAVLVQADLIRQKENAMTCNCVTCKLMVKWEKIAAVAKGVRTWWAK